MAQITITEEQEGAHGWEFLAHVHAPDGSESEHRLHLSWADYNHWSASGADAPTAVARAVLQFMAKRTDWLMKPTFDASEARRRFDGADEEIPRLIKP